MASPGTAPGDFLTVAEQMGRRLSAEAIWHEDRCNWLGAEPLQQSDAEIQAGITYRTLGPDLYSGTSGTALFLAELSGVTGEPRVRRTALAAIRQALSRIETVTPTARLGLFSGWTGVVLVAVRISMILDEPALLDQALQLLGESPLKATIPANSILCPARREQSRPLLS